MTIIIAYFNRAETTHAIPFYAKLIYFKSESFDCSIIECIGIAYDLFHIENCYLLLGRMLEICILVTCPLPLLHNQRIIGVAIVQYYDRTQSFVLFAVLFP